MNTSSTKRIQFQGHLGLEQGKAPQIVTTIEYEWHDPSSLKIELLLIGNEDEQEAASSFLRNRRYNHIWLYSDDDQVPSVEVLGIHRITESGPHISIGAGAVQVGLTKEPLPQDMKYYIKVELIPSGILSKAGIRKLRYTGDISFEPIVEGEIEVSSRFGILQAEERFDHYESVEFGNRVIKTVQRASITGSIDLPKGTHLFTVNENLGTEIEDIRLMLSFCYRQTVDYYEIHYLPDPKKARELKLNESLLRRKRDAPIGKIDQEELINYRNLIDGGLNRLLKSYLNFEHKDQLSRGVRFLSASYKTPTLESSYFLSYSALESVIGACSATSPFLLKSTKWENVGRLLREHLDQIAAAEGLEEVVGQMKEKLPELRRAPSDRRILEVCHTLNVKIADLWPREGFEAGIKKATKMRNDLFHSALCENPQDLSDNLIRLRTLTERILLKALKWPDDQIWVWYDQNLKWINM